MGRKRAQSLKLSIELTPGVRGIIDGVFKSL